MLQSPELGQSENIGSHQWCGLHTRFPDARRCPHFRLHDSLIHQLLQKCTQHILYLLIWYPVIKATPAPSLEPRFSVPDFVSQFKLRQIKLQQIKLQQIKLRDKIRNGEPGFEATLHHAADVGIRTITAHAGSLPFHCFRRSKFIRTFEQSSLPHFPTSSSDPK